jgi:phage-related protein (TIGR01555 family)
MDVFNAQARASKQAVDGMMKTRDGYENFINSIGLHQNNPQAGGYYDFDLITRNRLLLEAAYRGSWVLGVGIDAVADDMTREGVTLATSHAEADIPKLMPAFSRLKIWNSLNKGIKWGRLYGGSLGVMQIDGQDLSTPLNPKSIGNGQFKGIAVYDRWMLNPRMTPVINMGPDIGLPVYYELVASNLAYDPNSQPATGLKLVHHSRCFRHIGYELPFYQAITEMMWGMSIVERVWDRILAFDNTTLSSANLVDRASLRSVKVNGLREIAAAGGEALEGLKEQFEVMRLAQTNMGLSLLDKEDEFETSTYTFAGLSDILLQFGQQLSGATGVPMVRFFGQSPAGLNATGESDMRMYYDNIHAGQEATLRNPFDVMLKVLWKSETGWDPPDDLESSFNPLWQLSAKEKSDVAKVNVDAISAAHDKGFISTAGAMKELRQQSKETGLFTNITDEDIAAAEDEPAPMPDEPSSNDDKPEGDREGVPDKAKDAAERLRRWRWFK